MSKSIFIVRHAKSSWEGEAIRDKDRPLNDRGYRDAPVMARIMAEMVTPPVAFISSPAVRAFSTATIFRDAIRSVVPMSINDQLYYGDAGDYLEAVRGVDESYHTAALFGHNPKVEDFSCSVPGAYRQEIPTCAILFFRTDVDRWNEVDWENLRYAGHFFPKTI